MIICEGEGNGNGIDWLMISFGWWVIMMMTGIKVWGGDEEAVEP